MFNHKCQIFKLLEKMLVGARFKKSNQTEEKKRVFLMLGVVILHNFLPKDVNVKCFRGLKGRLNKHLRERSVAGN